MMFDDDDNVELELVEVDFIKPQTDKDKIMELYKKLDIKLDLLLEKIRERKKKAV